MPWTIYRYILREVLKLLVLSALVLVVVIGFAAAIKPLSDGLLGPTGLAKFVLYSMPTMIGLALPFAAAFASTLVFSRMSADSEILACRASGLSYRSIFLPMLFLGLGLTLGMFYLSNFVVPKFYLLAQQELEKDMVNVLVNQVHKRQAVKFRNLLLYADAADDTQPPPQIPDSPIQPYRMIILKGAAAGRRTNDGTLTKEGTAQQADVYLFRHRKQTWVMMRFKNAMVYDAEGGNFAMVSSWDIPPMPLPNPIKDRPQFLSWPELRELGQEPERFDRVRDSKENLIDMLTAEQLMRQIQMSLTEAAPRRVVLTAPEQDQRYIITAPIVERSSGVLRLSASDKTPIRIEVESNGMMIRQIEARSGNIAAEIDADDREPRLKIDVQRAQVADLRLGQRGAERGELVLPRTRWPTALSGPYRESSVLDLVHLARAEYGSSRRIGRAADTLESSIGYVGIATMVQLHDRAASAVACTLVLLLGAVLSTLMRGALPLVVYFCSFLLATVAVVITRSGGYIATDPTHGMWLGLGVMWLGNIVIIGAIVGAYWRLSKN